MPYSKRRLYAYTVSANPKKNWYGARALFRFVAKGKPKRKNPYFDPDSTLLEERVVLLQATSFADAIKKAEGEAKAYCKTVRFENIYGQNVELKYLGAMDVFEMSDPPGATCEVYSGMMIVPRSVRDSTLVTQRFGSERDRNQKYRDKFVDGLILAEAVQVAKELESQSARKKRITSKRAMQKPD